MTKAFTLVSAVTLLAGTAIASPKHKPVSPVSRILNQSPVTAKEKFLHAAFSGLNLSANKTTANQRVLTLTDYEYSTGRTALDSIRFAYSNGRGSQFDLFNLGYSNIDQPGPLQIGNTGYVQFERAYDMLSAGAEIVHRKYNANNLLDSNENQVQITVYKYNSSNQLEQLTAFGFSSSTQTWDSVYREFFRYDANNKLLLDSIELKSSATTWQPYVSYVYVNDASGRRISVFAENYSGGTYVRGGEAIFSYSGTSTLPNGYVIRDLDQSTMTLENSSKDTLGYTNGIPTYGDSYEWDPTTSDWGLVSQERRHLNGSNLPDSVSMIFWNLVTPTDSMYYIISYNSDNNPVSQIYYQYDATTADYSIHYTYEPVSNTGITRVNAERLNFYPNPVSDQLQLEGVSTGNYQICNAAGQLVQTGKIQSASAIPVQNLTPGLYILTVQDGNRKLQANFIRQ